MGQYEASKFTNAVSGRWIKNMHNKLPEFLPSKLKQRLADRFGDHWHRLEWEFQDAGTFLLLKLEVDQTFERRFSEKVEAFIRNEMLSEGIIEDEGDYRWILVLTKNGEVIDSLIPEFSSNG